MVPRRPMAMRLPQSRGVDRTAMAVRTAWSNEAADVPPTALAVVHMAKRASATTALVTTRSGSVGYLPEPEQLELRSRALR